MMMSLKSDSKSALSIAARLNTSKNANQIGGEIAYLYTEAAYQPRYVTHVPGVANVMADALSRLTDPTKHYQIPNELLTVKRVEVPLRTRDWYKTLAAKQVG